MSEKIHSHDYKQLERVFKTIENSLAEVNLILKNTSKQQIFENYAETYYRKGQYCFKDILDNLETFDGVKPD